MSYKLRACVLFEVAVDRERANVARVELKVFLLIDLMEPGDSGAPALASGAHKRLPAEGLEGVLKRILVGF